MNIQHIGNYRIIRQLGEGGMGTVYEGRHDQIGRRAAIKVLRPELASNPQIVTRFLNEARAANLVQHPGIVDIYEFGQTPEGAAYIVMQYLEGESLRGRLLRQGALGVDALRLGRQMASALAAAHDQGIVHRDLKPENVMIVADPEAPGNERAKVLDFGIAKLATELKAPGEQATHTGMMMGTPTYMAPEQCRGLTNLNDRADVYALGIMLYEMTSGLTPFQGDMGELIAAHMFMAPPSLVGAPELDLLVQRMLHKTADQRPSMRQVATELEALQGGVRGGVLSGMQPRIASVPPTLGEAVLNSTLGRSNGQVRHSRPPLGNGRNSLWTGVALAGLLAVGGGGVALYSRNKTVSPSPSGLHSAAAPPATAATPPGPSITPPVVVKPPVEPQKPDPEIPDPAKNQDAAQPVTDDTTDDTGAKATKGSGATRGAKHSKKKHKAPTSPQVTGQPASQPVEDEYVPKLLH